MGEWRRRGQESLVDVLLNKALHTILRFLKNVVYIVFDFYFPIGNKFFKSGK